MGGRIEIRGVETVVKNMSELTDELKVEFEKSLKYVGGVLHKKVKEKAGLTDHTLEDLADLGHPYSKRFPTDSGPHKDELVHKQGNLLSENIEKISIIKKDVIVMAVGVDEKKVPYIKYLIKGTSKMRPRDFLGHAWSENKDDLFKMLKAGLVKGVKSRRGKTGR